MSKPFNIFNLFLIFCFALFSNSYAQERNDYRLLWEIQHKDSSKKSYLFGTIHLKDKRVFNFSDAVIPAIRNSEAFALEIHPDSISYDFTKKLFETDQEDIYKKILSESDYERLKARYKELNGKSLDSSNFKSPLYIESMLVKDLVKEDDKRTFLDAYLYGVAYSYDREIFGLEKMEDQIPNMEDVSEEELRENILSLLDTDDAEYEQYINEMVEMYYTGDIDEIFRQFVGLFSMDKVLNARNYVMANSMEKIMKTKSLFAAVGTAHLPGHEGIIEILRRRGYTVTNVEATFENDPEDFNISPNLAKWHLNERPDLGYRVMTPTQAVPMEYDGKIKVMLANDLIFGSVFGYLAVDLRGQELVKDFDFIGKMIQNQTAGNEENIIKRESFEKNGIQFTDVTLLGLDGYTRMQLAFANKIVYSFYLQNSLDELKTPYVNAFFDSIEIFAPEVEASTWSPLEENIGAFSVNYPGPLKDISREVANPFGAGLPPYFLTMYLAEDKANNMIYLLRYNDQPFGYYVENDTTHLEYIENYFKDKGEIIGTPKPFKIGTYEGLEFELLLSGKYHTFARFFLRANRTYLMLAQKSVIEEKTVVDNPFFSSFKLEPYALSSLDSIISIDKKYSFKMPKNTTKEVDSLGYYSTEYDVSTIYLATQPNTGSVYGCTQTTIKPYYRSESTAAFYESYIETILEDHDSVLTNKGVMVSGQPGRQLYIKNSLTKVHQRLQLVYDNNSVFQMIVYAGEEEISTPSIDDFFQSFKIQNTKKRFDLTSSKTKLILKNLKSKDSIKQEQASDAFHYYVFEKSDSNALVKSLDENFGDDYSNSRIKNNLIGAITTLGGSKNLQTLKKFYLDGKTKNAQKIFILQNLLNFRTSEATDIYFDLLANHKPIRGLNTYFNIFETLGDSIPLLMAKEPKVVGLLNESDYRDELVRLYRKNVLSDSAAYSKMVGFKEAILSQMEADVISYIDTIQRNKSTHLSYQLIDDYISIIGLTNTKNAQSEKVLKLLYTGLEDNHWSKTASLLKAIEFGFEIERPVITEALANLYSRFELMEGLLDANRSSLIPKKYLEAEAFSKLSIYNAIGSDDAYPDIMNKLGTFTFREQEYIAFEFGYYSEEKHIRYMGVTKLDAPNTDKLKANLCYRDWELLESDWESQAKKLLETALD